MDLDAFNSIIWVVKFLTDYCAVMGRICVEMYDNSTLLTKENHRFSIDVNHQMI